MSFRVQYDPACISRGLSSRRTTDLEQALTDINEVEKGVFHTLSLTRNEPACFIFVTLALVCRRCVRGPFLQQLVFLEVCVNGTVAVVGPGVLDEVARRAKPVDRRRL